MAKAGAMLVAGFMAEERREVYADLQNAASFHCQVEQWKDCEELRPKRKEKWSFVDKRRERMKPRTEWCAEANRYRCMRCGKRSKYMKMPGKCAAPKFLSKRVGKCGSRHLGGHGLVRRMDTQGEVLTWCRKCSGYARQRMGPKLMNCCRLEQMDTKELGKIVKENKFSRKKESQPKKQRIGESREKRKITRKEYERLLNNFEMEGLMAQNGLRNLAKEKIKKEGRELPNEEEDVVREHKAVHEEDFWSSWRREDEKSKEERKAEAEGKGEEEGENRKREGEKEENETVTVNRRCEGFVSVEA